MTLDERIKGLEAIRQDFNIEMTTFQVKAIKEQIELLKAEKQRIENYLLIKDEIIK